MKDFKKCRIGGCTHFCEEGYDRGYQEAWVGVEKYAAVFFFMGLILGAAIVFFIK